MIYYAKYHKDGNSFIITEQQDICGENKKTLAETLCRQDTNIGADSLTVCDTSQHFISMVSYSRNGMRQPLNGNGIACLIQYCYEYGFLLEREAYIKTDAALVGVKIKKTSPFTTAVYLPPAIFSAESCCMPESVYTEEIYIEREKTMKRIFSLLLVVVLVFGTTSVYALSWTPTSEPCKTYTINIVKYELIPGDVGNSFRVNPNTTARKGEYAYYSIEVYNADNQKVDPGKLIVTDMAAPTNLDNGLYAALVTGSRPMLTYSIEEKTSLQELHYNNMPITISGDTVTIGKLVFTRSVSGVVTDVHFDGNILELTKELTALNMTPEDVYNGKVCMSNDVLIQNFGMICKQTATSKWYNDADAIKNITIPKTGDAPLNALFVALVTLVTTGVAICFSCRFKQKKD